MGPNYPALGNKNPRMFYSFMSKSMKYEESAILFTFFPNLRLSLKKTSLLLSYWSFIAIGDLNLKHDLLKPQEKIQKYFLKKFGG